MALSCAHPLASADEIAADELANDVMIIRRHCEVLSETSRHFVEQGVRPPFALRTNNDEKAMALVRAGYGVTVMPDCYRDLRLRRIKLKGFVLRRSIGLRVGKPRPQLEQHLRTIASAARSAFEMASH